MVACWFENQSFWLKDKFRFCPVATQGLEDDCQNQCVSIAVLRRRISHIKVYWWGRSLVGESNWNISMCCRWRIYSTRTFLSSGCIWPSFFCCVGADFQMCRSTEAHTAAASLQEDMGSMLGWLDKAETVLAVPLQPAEPQYIRNTLSKVQVPLLLQTAVLMIHRALCVGVCIE